MAESTKELRQRITGISNIQKITRAMEMVATTKLRRFQDRATASRPYADEISGLMGRLTAVLGEDVAGRPIELGDVGVATRAVLVETIAEEPLVGRDAGAAPGHFGQQLVPRVNARRGELCPPVDPGGGTSHKRKMLFVYLGAWLASGVRYHTTDPGTFCRAKSQTFLYPQRLN